LVPRADEWSLQINGISHHSGQCRIECNENNKGIGLQYGWTDESGYAKALTAGTLINSMNDRSYYAGGATKLTLGPVGVGAFYGLIYYPAEQANWWPALLPILSLDFKHFGINALYIPAVSDQIVPAWLFQLVVPIRDGHNAIYFRPSYRSRSTRDWS
jgi:hypothetical protein